MVWVWLFVALFGEIGLALFVVGALTEMSLLGLAAGFGGSRLGPSVTFSFLWWVDGALSAFLLVVGLRGIKHEQRVARRIDSEPAPISSSRGHRQSRRVPPARAAWGPERRMRVAQGSVLRGEATLRRCRRNSISWCSATPIPI